MNITRESFKPYAKLKREAVEIPELGGELFVREMSAGEALSVSNAGKFDPLPILVKVVLDAEGRRIFRDGDEELLGSSLSIQSINLLIEAVTRLSGMGVEAKK